jgi:hypothetical protein
VLTRQRAFLVGTAAAAGLPPALLAFRSGGYFPGDWGLQLGFFALLTLVVLTVSERVPVERLELAMLGSIFGLALWTLLSVSWSPSAEQPVLSAERVLVYAAAIAALLLIARRERAQALLAGLLVVLR